MTALCPRCWGARVEGGSRDACVLCRGSGSVEDRALAPHFRLSELLRSSRAVREHIPNDPAPVVQEHLGALARELLEPIRTQFGALHVGSGYRCAKLNGDTPGASRTSAHPFGWAADFVPVAPDVTLRAIVEWVAGSSLPFDQVIYEGTWVHVGLVYPPTGTRRALVMQAFPDPTADPKHPKLKYEAFNPRDPRVL